MHCLYQSNWAAEYPALQSLLSSTTYSSFPPFLLKYAPFHHTTFIVLSTLLTELNPPARTDCVFVLLGDTNVFFMHGKCKCVYATDTLTHSLTHSLNHSLTHSLTHSLSTCHILVISHPTLLSPASWYHNPLDSFSNLQVVILTTGCMTTLGTLT